MSDLIRVPQQQRAYESLNRVLNAGASLFAEVGFERLTIQQVSKRAGVSVGAIYTRFGNKQNLVRAIHRHAMDKVAEASVEYLAPGPWLDGLSAEQFVVELVRREAHVFVDHRDLLHASMHLGAVDQVVSSRGSAGSREAAQNFRDRVLDRIGGEIVRENTEQAVDVCWRLVYSTLARQIMYGPTFESDYAIPWDDLVDALGDVCVGYLLRNP